jgi:hypothetical protein
MVGLCASDREDDVGSLLQYLCKVILELPRLVPSHGETGLIIPFDEEAGESDRSGKPRDFLYRRWNIRQQDAGDPVERFVRGGNGLHVAVHAGFRIRLLSCGR